MIYQEIYYLCRYNLLLIIWKGQTMKYIYKTLSIIILLLVVIYSPLIVSAENIAHSSSGWFRGPVTSPYGDRVHPIQGKLLYI